MVLICNNSKFYSNACRVLLDTWRKNLLLRPLLAGVKTMEEKIGLPSKPKKPLTPYFRYMKQIRPKIVEENPEANIVDIVKIASKQWENVDQKVKQKLQDEFRKDQVLYLKSKTQYDCRLTDEQKAEIKQFKQEMAEAKERKIIKKRIKELGRPKKPASSFLKYLVEQRTIASQVNNESYKEWHRKITTQWSQMTDSAKTPYIEKARKELEIYRKEMAIWEEKMIQLGHVDVVRHEALIDPADISLKPKTNK